MKKKYRNSLRTLAFTMSAVSILTPVGVNASGEDLQQKKVQTEDISIDEKKAGPGSLADRQMVQNGISESEEKKEKEESAAKEEKEEKKESDSMKVEGESKDTDISDDRKETEVQINKTSTEAEEEDEEDSLEKKTEDGESESALKPGNKTPEEEQSDIGSEEEQSDAEMKEGDLNDNLPEEQNLKNDTEIHDLPVEGMDPMEEKEKTEEPENVKNEPLQKAEDFKEAKDSEKEKAGTEAEKEPTRDGNSEERINESGDGKQRAAEKTETKALPDTKKEETKTHQTGKEAQTVPEEGTKTVQKAVVIQEPKKEEKTDAGAVQNPPTLTEGSARKNSEDSGQKSTVKGTPEDFSQKGTRTGPGDSAQKSSVTGTPGEKIGRKDTKNPVITISGAKDRSSNRRPLQISVDFQDENLREGSAYAYLTATNSGKRIEGIRKDGSSAETAFEFPKISEDDYYVLTAGCSDMNGNETVKKISFTENQKGTVTALKSVSLKDRTVSRKKVSPEFDVSGVDEITEAVAEVNGKRVPVRFNKEGNLILSSPLTKEGDYTVQIRTKDASGNEVRSEPVRFAIDRTKPKISMKKKDSAGEDQNAGDKGTDIVISKDQPHDTFTEILVDGRKIEKDEYTTLKNGNVHLNVPGKGAHTVRVTAEDEAGNKKTSDMTFSADTVKKKSRSGMPVTAGILFAAGTASAGAALYIRRKKICRK